MKRASPTRQSLAALGLYGFVLLTYPLLGLPKGNLFGVPAVYLYLFGVWSGLICLAAMISERKG